jgi:hypothetical protein
MNNIILTTFLALNPVLLFAQLPAGSVAQYPLNNTANDVSGNGNNGTLASTSSDFNRFGTANTATAFIAGTSTGTFPGTLETAMSNVFSLGYWFKTSMSAPSAAQWYSGIALVDAEVCGVTNDWGTALIDGGKVCLGIGNPDMTIKSTATYNDGIWHFLTATWDPVAATMVLYVDGSQVATASGTGTAARSAPPLIGMGRNPCVASGVYTGSLDDAIAYNRALSPIEVSNLYNYFNAIPLPLQWESFSGQAEGQLVYLKWVTGAEIDNDHFDIERSADGNYFSAIGTVPDRDGIKISSGSSLYHFTDANPTQGNNYYRIRQVDIDGKYTYSYIVVVFLKKAGSGISLQTNPVGGELAMVNDGLVLIQRIQVMDISGRILIDQATNSGNSLVKISSAGLSPGYYILKIAAGGNYTTIGFLKL